MRLIAEIGINHSGEVETAEKLISSAASCQCWGVKFQYRKLDNFYDSIDEIGDGIVYEDLVKCQLSISQIIELTQYTRKLGLKVGISFFRAEDVRDFGIEIQHFDFFKVPSAECLNTELIELLLSFGKDVLVSSGGHLLSDIQKRLVKYKNKITILHCIANYPTKMGNQQLGAIGELKKLGFKSVGYSSHDEDFEMCMFAMSYGLDYLERHITLDKKGNGLDHSSSSDIPEFKRLGKLSNSIETIMSYDAEFINQGELINMQNLGCGLYLSKNIKKGGVVREDDFSIKAPRLGISYGEYLSEFKNKNLTHSVEKGACLKSSDYEKNSNFDIRGLSMFANNRSISLPVRLHDFKFFNDTFELQNYEFHLSYQEILKGEFYNIAQAVTSSKTVSIHLPDYIPGNKILDPISQCDEVKSGSIDIIERSKEFAKVLFDVTGKKIKIVGSFSRINRNKSYTLEKINEFVSSAETAYCEILPQWLPGFAWYFGGAEKLALFNDEKDIEFIQENNMSICLDVSHLGMSAATHNSSVDSWFEALAPFASHLHVADFKGEDGEGMQIGDGELKIFDRLLDSKKVKVLEVWQGHLDNGAGFKKALQNLQYIDGINA
jgi:N-acetylneuraminate synthase